MLKYIKVKATKNVTTATVGKKKVAVIDTTNMNTTVAVVTALENAGYGPNLTKELIYKTLVAKGW